MANRQTLVVGAVGILVGMVVGASATQSAQTVLFAGTDPNAAVDLYVPHESDGSYTNRRGIREGIDGLRRLIDIRRISDMRKADRLIHGAAPTQIGIGVEVNNDLNFDHCEGLTRSRLTRCIVEYLENGVRYQRRQTDLGQ